MKSIYLDVNKCSNTEPDFVTGSCVGHSVGKVLQHYPFKYFFCSLFSFTRIPIMPMLHLLKLQFWNVLFYVSIALSSSSLTLSRIVPTVLGSPSNASFNLDS
jgi:hypothetical protein